MIEFCQINGIPYSRNNLGLQAGNPAGDTAVGIAVALALDTVGLVEARIVVELGTFVVGALEPDKTAVERMRLKERLDYRARSFDIDILRDRTGPQFHPWVAYLVSLEAPVQQFD